MARRERENGLEELACPVAKDWPQAKEAMRRGEEVHEKIETIEQRSSHLESLPNIASTLKSLNRNITITLALLGALLLIKELRGSDYNFKAGATGIEISREK